MAAERNYLPKVLNIWTMNSMIPKPVSLNSMLYSTNQRSTETKLTVTYHVYMAKNTVKSEITLYSDIAVGLKILGCLVRFYWVPSWNFWAQFCRNSTKVSMMVQKLIILFNFEYEGQGWMSLPVLKQKGRVGNALYLPRCLPEAADRIRSGIANSILKQVHPPGLWGRVAGRLQEKKNSTG